MVVLLQARFSAAQPRHPFAGAPRTRAQAGKPRSPTVLKKPNDGSRQHRRGMRARRFWQLGTTGLPCSRFCLVSKGGAELNENKLRTSFQPKEAAATATI